MRRAVTVALLLAASPACAQGPSLTQRWTGHWFGTGQPGDRSQMYIDSFEPDGSFHVLHRACVQGKAHDQTQTGRWRIEGNILTISIATVNGQPEQHDDRYRVNAADGKTQDYTYLPNNFGYKSRKVDAKFQMPPCDLVS